jgi:hypothetical protein
MKNFLSIVPMHTLHFILYDTSVVQCEQKELETARPWPILGYYHDIYLEVLKKISEKLRQDSRC